MEPVQLGRSGLRVSPLCLGTMNFGTDTPPAEATRILDVALDAGLFFLDTADMYGKGASERFLGEALRGRRDQVVLATKAFAPMGPGPNDRGLSARHLIAACEASLRRLNTDWIDLYYLHIPDAAVPIDESLRALEDLRRAGKVRYLAASNYRAWELVNMLHTADHLGAARLTATQPLYNLVNRDIEVELLPMAAHHGLGVVSYSPIARGVLSGKYQWDAPPPTSSRLARSNPRFLQAEWREASLHVAHALAPQAAARGVSLATFATAWCLNNPLVHSVIIGPRTESQLTDYLAAPTTPWDPEAEAAVDALVPPGSHTGFGWPDAQYPVLGRPVAG